MKYYETKLCLFNSIPKIHRAPKKLKIISLDKENCKVCCKTSPIKCYSTKNRWKRDHNNKTQERAKETKTPSSMELMIVTLYY